MPIIYWSLRSHCCYEKQKNPGTLSQCKTWSFIWNRISRESCTYRIFVGPDNSTAFSPWTYAIETAFHEMLLQSPHRTLDPDEADFFYVPVYTSCFMHPVFGWSDHPFWHGPSPQGEFLQRGLHNFKVSCSQLHVFCVPFNRFAQLHVFTAAFYHKSPMLDV